MNKIRKGKYIENKAADALKSQGWQILFKSVFVRFQNIDFGGLFDIVAVKGNIYRFIQVKTEKCDKKQRDALRNYYKEHANEFINCELWIYKKKKREFVIYKNEDL
jgi:Holliday junction resolvase-like predicted endonuclease